LKELGNLDMLVRISDAIYNIDMTYSEIAKKIGCSRNTLYCYKDMVSVMNVAHLKGLCDLTGKSADYFLYGKDKK